MSEVKLRIDGDSSGAAKAIDDVKKKQKELDDVIQKATIASGIAFAGLSASIVGVLDAFSENEQAALRQEAVLKSTGFAAGLTASELDRMARALQDSTRFSDDNIASAQNALLTFTKIGRETFPEATKAVLDFAQANGVDATGAAQLLGRALNDPIRGVTQLSRAGIQFTEQQKNQMEALVKIRPLFSSNFP
jgi:phage-related minor tail protein